MSGSKIIGRPDAIKIEQVIYVVIPSWCLQFKLHLYWCRWPIRINHLKDVWSETVTLRVSAGRTWCIICIIWQPNIAQRASRSTRAGYPTLHGMFIVGPLESSMEELISHCRTQDVISQSLQTFSALWGGCSGAYKLWAYLSSRDLKRT